MMYCAVYRLGLGYFKDDLSFKFVTLRLSDITMCYIFSKLRYKLCMETSKEILKSDLRIERTVDINYSLLLMSLNFFFFFFLKIVKHLLPWYVKWLLLM